MIQQKKDLETIANQVCEEHGLTTKHLMQKYYGSNRQVAELKQDFVVRAREHYTNLEIADFLNYSPTSASQLYTKATGGFTPKWKRMLDSLRQGEVITEDEFSNLRNNIYRLYNMGYRNIYRSEGGYKMAQ